MFGITTSGTRSAAYQSPFVGSMTNVVQLAVNAASLGAREVDINGNLKAGVPLRGVGGAGSIIPTGVPGQNMGFGDEGGVTFEAVKIAKSNSSADLTAAGTVHITVGQGNVNPTACQEMLGAALDANELAASSIAGSNIAFVGE